MFTDYRVMSVTERDSHTSLCEKCPACIKQVLKPGWLLKKRKERLTCEIYTDL